MDYVLLSALAGSLFLGSFGTYLVLSSKLKYKEKQLLDLALNIKMKEDELINEKSKFELLREENLGIQTLLSGMEAQRDALKNQLTQLQDINEKYAASVSEATELRVRLEEERSSNTEKLQMLKNAEKEMSLQFSKLANEIFEHKSKVYAQQNRLQLDTILQPFKEQVDSFGKKIEENYVRQSKERHLLKEQIVHLRSLNERLSDEANNLTKALKGENKTQGNWGELILEKILESSGLRQGYEYETQASFKNDKGKLYRPDIIVHLPDNKDIIIDSKVSLLAYERYVNAQDEDEKALARKDHVASIRAHIKGLSKKRYEDLNGLRSLDFVLLFMSIEGAYMLGLEEDSNFFQEAIKQNIMVIGPSTLLVTLRTIEYIWRNERQEQNAQEIAQNAANLYDKFVGFIEDMEKIGASIGRTQQSYEDAMNKLQNGRGNLIKRTEDMKKLGLKTKKNLNSNILEKANVDA